MQINLNPTSERGASRDAVNRPRETLGDSHLISSDPRSRFGLVCDLLCCRGNSCIERSETTEGILAIAGIEIDVAEADVEFEVDVRVFLGQVSGSTWFPGPFVAFEADRQVQFRVDE